MYISVHIPKTAGSSFLRHLEQLFPKRVCYDYGNQYALSDPNSPTAKIYAHRAVKIARFRIRVRQHRKETDQCIHGHFRADKYDASFPNAQLITWVRDPVERVISQYYFWQRNPDLGHSICAHMLRNKLSLLEFASIDAMRNLQATYLGPKQIANFWFVGIQENFDDCIRSLYNQLGTDYAEIKIKNINPGKPLHAKYTVESEIRRKIADLNQADMAIYAAAVDKANGDGILNRATESYSDTSPMVYV